MILCFIKRTVYPYSLNYLIKNGNKNIVVNVYGLFNMFNDSICLIIELFILTD